MTSAVNTGQRQQLKLGMGFSLLFHGALIATLLYLVHPHADFLAPSQAMPVVELAPPAPAAAVAPAAEAAPAPSRVVGTVVPPSYFGELESLIQKSLQYPGRSIANDEEGSCTVRVSFGRNGAIEGAQMAAASGYTALDGECREVFRRIGRFPPVPSDTSPDATDFTIELPISFRLQ